MASPNDIWSKQKWTPTLSPSTGPFFKGPVIWGRYRGDGEHIKRQHRGAYEDLWPCTIRTFWPLPVPRINLSAAIFHFVWPDSQILPVAFLSPHSAHSTVAIPQCRSRPERPRISIESVGVECRPGGFLLFGMHSELSPAEKGGGRVKLLFPLTDCSRNILE